MRPALLIERRREQNDSLSSMIDRIVLSIDSGGEDKARFLLIANQVPSTIGARVLFDPEHRRRIGALSAADVSRRSTN